MPPNVFICVPTYRETEQVRGLLHSLRNVRYRPLELIIVNANPGDETSYLIAQESKMTEYSIREEFGCPDQYWSATVNKGLRRVIQEAAVDDWVLLTNIDITFDHDLVDALLREAIKRSPCQMGALGHANGIVVSNGVQVRSWAMTLNRHPLAGFAIEDIPNEFVAPVNFLPTRCMIFPAEALTRTGLMAERLLPHYGADYEFSRRLARMGYKPYLCGEVRFQSDTKNTGKSVYSRKTTFKERLSNIMNIKNPENPKYRTNFLLLSYPFYAIPTAVMIYLLRTFLEVCFGGELLRRIVPGREHGFS